MANTDFGKFGTASSDKNIPADNNTAAAAVNDDDRALDWDEEIECEDKQFITLNPGVYQFKVNKFDRGRYNGSDDGSKKPCNIAKIELVIETEGGMAIVNESFFLKAKQMFLVANFFRAIGLAKPGEKFTPNWSKAIGCTGKAKIKNRTYKDNTYNAVESYVFPDK